MDRRETFPGGRVQAHQPFAAVVYLFVVVLDDNDEEVGEGEGEGDVVVLTENTLGLIGDESVRARAGMDRVEPFRSHSEILMTGADDEIHDGQVGQDN
jgi:hypothetical protein